MSVQPRTTEVVIYQGDDLAEIAFLRKKADAAARRVAEQKQAGTSRGGGDTSAADAEAEHDAYVAEAAGRAVTVKLRALGRKQWAALVGECPPRFQDRKIDDAKSEVMHPEDQPYGVDSTRFGEKLLLFRHPDREDMRTVLEPAYSATELQNFLDDLSDGDFDRLWTTAFYLNSAAGGDPRDFTYSTPTPTSE